MMAPVYNIESNPPGFASWNEISTFTSTGRWEIQAHGDQAHNMIKMDQEGHLRLFLTHKRWLDEKGRLETLDEWQDRIAADHESAKAKIRTHLGTVPVAFAYPEGDYGQVGTPNFPQSAALNRGSLCVQYYSICYTQDDIGLNVRSRDHALISRVEPQQGWTPEHLMRLISDRSAFVQMRQQLLLWDAWDGHPRAAYNWLELNRRAGVSKPLLLASEAQIRFTTGDHEQGLQLAQQALTLDPTLDNQLLVQSMAQSFNHDWAPSVSIFHDSHTRQNILFEQSVGSLEFHGVLMRALQGYSNYRESGVQPVGDVSAGVELKRVMGLGQTLSFQAAQHFLTGQGHDSFSVDGDFNSDWSSTFQTEASAGRNPYGMARALDADIDDQFVDLKASVGSDEKGKAQAEMRLADPTDNNERFTATIGGIWPFALDGQIRIVGRFTADTTRFVSPNYYSPQALYMNQVGLGYLARVNETLKIDLSYLPGYGIEEGASNSYVQDVELNVEWDWQKKLQVRPSILLSSTPNYHSETYGLVLVRQF